MRIGVASYKIDSNVGADSVNYIDFLSDALKHNLSLFVGPDYTLSHSFEPLSIDEEKNVSEALVDISRKHPRTTIVPGTMSYQRENKMFHVAPVFYDGKKVAEFLKQTDHGEAEVAQKAGLEYVRGTGMANTFDVEGKKAWLHICGDRGRKPESICRDSDLEITVAHDRNACIFFDTMTPKNPRTIILSDSYHPAVQVVRYNSPDSINLLNPIEVSQFHKLHKVQASNKNMPRVEVFDIK